MSAEHTVIRAQLDKLLDLHELLCAGKGQELHCEYKNEKLKDLVEKLELIIEAQKSLEQLEEWQLYKTTGALPKATTASSAVTPTSEDSPQAVSQTLLFTTIQARQARKQQEEEDEKGEYQRILDMKKGKKK